ncbi:MAG: hypothetical protein JNM83_11920 [Myxococcales bacterium]|nr:hypothetical protein [Myxococcales bacterium]
MTPAKKWLTFGFMFTLILGGGAGGAYYYHQRELRAAYDRAGKDLWISRSRSLLLEAALATRYGNYAMAFERVVRAQAASARLALPLDKEFAEAQQLLLQQRPDVEITLKLMVIADRIEPPAPLGPPDPARKGGVATGEQMGLSSAKSIQPSPNPAPPSPSALPAAATPPVAAPAGTSPAATPPAAAAPPAAPAGTPSTAAAPQALPKRGQSPEASLEEGRQALGQAKILLLSGREAPAVIEWLARAQVVLDDSGKSDFDEPILAAIKAVRSGDEAKAQKIIDAALSKLRGQ